MIRIWLLVWVFFGSLALLGCDGGISPGAAKAPVFHGPDDPAVLQVGDSVLHRSDLSSLNGRNDPAAKSGISREQLTTLIAFELQAQEARRRGLDRDPEVVRTTRAALAHVFLGATMETLVTPADITQQEVEDYYKGHAVEYREAEIRHVSQILIIPRPPMDEAAWRAAEQRAADIRRELMAALPKNKEAFAEFVAKYSQDSGTVKKGGAMAPLRLREEGGTMPKPYTDAAFALSREQQISEPVRTSEGVHLIKLRSIERRPGKTLEQASELIRKMLANQKKARAFEDFMKSLENRYRVKVYDDALEAFTPTGVTPKADRPQQGR